MNKVEPPHKRLRLWRWLAAVALLIVLLPPGLLILWSLPAAWSDPMRMLAARRSTTFTYEQGPLEIDGPLKIRPVRIMGESDRGRRVAFDAYLCEPIKADAPIPGFILLGGVRTGRNAARILARYPELARAGAFLALDYPWDGPRQFRGLEILGHLGPLRRAVFDGVEAARLAIDYLEQQPRIDPDRLFLTGVSLGAFYAIAAGALEERPAAVLALMGGGDLSYLFEANLRYMEYVRNPLAARGVGGLAGLLVRPLEPLRLVGHISPIPYIQVNATHDERIPPRSAQILFEAAREPKSMHWLETDHVLPHLDDVIEILIRAALQELQKQGLLMPAAHSGP